MKVSFGLTCSASCPRQPAVSGAPSLALGLHFSCLPPSPEPPTGSQPGEHCFEAELTVRQCVLWTVVILVFLRFTLLFISNLLLLTLYVVSVQELCSQSHVSPGPHCTAQVTTSFSSPHQHTMPSLDILSYPEGFLRVSHTSRESVYSWLFSLCLKHICFFNCIPFNPVPQSGKCR